MKTVTIKTLNVSITSNEAGMFNLNDIWNKCNLPDAKRPRSWRNDVRKAMERSTNLYSDKQGNGNATWATEQAVYAYAMFVSTEFYMLVVEAFTALVNGEVEEATKIAKSAVEIVHEATLISKPRHRIRLFLNDYTDISEGTEAWINAMHNNAKATNEDRVRTLASLTKAIDESYDKLSARNLTGAALHEKALKLVHKEERRLARIDSSK